MKVGPYFAKDILKAQKLKRMLNLLAALLVVETGWLDYTNRLLSKRYHRNEDTGHAQSLWIAVILVKTFTLYI